MLVIPVEIKKLGLSIKEAKGGTESSLEISNGYFSAPRAVRTPGRSATSTDQHASCGGNKRGMNRGVGVQHMGLSGTIDLAYSGNKIVWWEESRPPIWKDTAPLFKLWTVQFKV